MANRIDTPPFDTQLREPDPVYTDLLDNLPPPQPQQEERQPCGHSRRWRTRYGHTCLACEVEALRDVERKKVGF